MTCSAMGIWKTEAAIMTVGGSEGKTQVEVKMMAGSQHFKLIPNGNGNHKDVKEHIHAQNIPRVESHAESFKD